MASSYPGSLDAFDSIASDKKTSDVVGGRTHRDMHNDLGDAIEAVQAELGTDPAGSFATVKARLDQFVAYAAKTGAYTATAADHTLNVTSGTFTLDLPAASTCTGQSLKVKNSGTGVVTLDGNSSETVEGVATFPLGAGSYVEITSTGSAWILTAGSPDTGLRDMRASSMSNGWSAASGDFRLRRVGNMVHVSGTWDAAAASSDTAYTLPSGFRPQTSACFGVAHYLSTAASSRLLEVGSNGVMKFYNRGAGNHFFHITFPTADAWPTTLP